MESPSIQDIEAYLNHPEEEVRRKGLEGLLFHPPKDVAPLIMKALGDRSWRVRKHAVEIISRFPGREELIPCLIEGLRNEDNVGLRNACVEALIRMGKAGLPFLKEIIKDEDRDVRKFAADIMGEIGEEEAIDCLLEATGDRDENVRIAAIEAIGKIGGEKGTTLLLGLLRRGDTTTKFTILETLSGTKGPIPLEEVYRVLDNRILKKAAFDLLKEVGDESSLPYLVEGLKDHSQVVVESAMRAIYWLLSRRPEMEERLGEELEGTREDMREKVRRALYSDSVETKRGAILMAGLLRDPNLIPHLLRIMEEGLEGMIVKAILSMEGAGRTLLKIFPGEDPKTKAGICYILGRLRYKDAEEILLQCLEEENGHLRASAATALGEIGSKRAIDPLINLLNDPYEDVRTAARKALSTLGRGEEGFLERMRGLLSSPSSHMRRHVITILGTIGGKKETETLSLGLKDEDPEVRSTTVRVIGEAGLKEMVEEIIAALTDESPAVRREAARVLGRWRCKEAEGPLLLLLTDEDIWVRCEAIEGLSLIKGERALSTIREEALKGKGIIAIKAIEALKRMDPEGSIDVFLECLEREEKEIRKASLEALQGILDKERVDRVLPFLKGKEWDLRNEAVKTVASLGPSSLPYLEEALKEESDPTVLKTLEEAIVRLRKGDRNV